MATAAEHIAWLDAFGDDASHPGTVANHVGYRRAALAALAAVGDTVAAAYLAKPATTTITVNTGRLNSLRAAIENLSAFRREQEDDDGGEPMCGYPEYDETVTDYCRDIAEIAEGLFS